MTTAPVSRTADCGCGPAGCGASATLRGQALSRALRLEYLTVAWNVVEGVVAIGAALAAGSVAILGFGIDSFVECASAFVLIWRLRSERDRRLAGAAAEALEGRARRLVAASLFLLAAYVALDAIQVLVTADRPAFSAVGSGLLALSIVAMVFLARAKRRLGVELGSEALAADAFQTTACWWLSLAALAGVGLNGAFGWWWADPVAALVIAALIAREGRESWAGRSCC